MSYTANLNSALTYFKADRPELAKKSLLRAYSEVPDSEKQGDNPDYLKILALLGKLSLTDGKLEKAESFIDQGLSCKNDHIDLMFLKILYLFEMHQYDQMFAFLGLYLLAVDNQQCNYNYEFGSENAVNEVTHNLVKTAYKNSPNRVEIETILQKLGVASGSKRIAQALEVINELKENPKWQSVKSN